MKRGAAVLLTLLVIAATSIHADQAAAGGITEGMTLASALSRLQAQGLKIIYSSDLVRSGMIVLREPRPGSARAILEEILAPHGLEVRGGPGGSLLVVKAPARGSISGIVRDGREGQPLPRAAIAVTGTDVRVITDQAGRFETTPLPAGQYTIEVRHASYLSERFEEIPVKGGQDTEVRLDLTPINLSSEEIVVTSESRSTESETPEDRWHLDRTAIEQTPRVASDPLLALERVPGVVAGEGGTRLNIRGGASDEVQIILDGMELYDPFHLKERKGLFSMIDDRGIEAVDVLDGGFPAEYGGRMSGVIDFTSRDFAGEESYEIGVTSDISRLLGEGSLAEGRGQWLAAGRVGYPRSVLEGLAADPGYDPQYYDFFGKARIDIGPSTALTFNVLTGLDELHGDHGGFVGILNDRGTFRTRDTSAYAWVGLERTTPALFSRTVLSFGRLEQDRAGSSLNLDQVEDRRTTGLLGLKQSWFAESSRHALKWGFDVRKLDAEYDYLSVASGESGAGPTAIAPSGEEIGAHLSDRIRLHESLDVELGVRWDRQSYVPQSGGTVSPRLNIVFRPGARSEIRAGWGYFHQHQRINELQVEDGVTDFAPSERSEHGILSFRYRFDGDLDMRVSVYRKRMTDVRPRFENLFDPFVFFPESSDDRVMIDPESSEARGLELSLAGRGSPRLSWSGSYSLASVEDVIDGLDVPRSWDQRHSLRFDLAYELSEGWRMNLASTYRSGGPTTPLEAETRLGPEGALEIVPIAGERNSDRLPPFHRLDLGVTRTFDTSRGGLDLFLNVINVTNRKNVCCVDGFDFDLLSDGAVDVDREGRGGLARTLSYGLSWRF